MSNQTFPPGGVVYHTRRDQVQVALMNGPEHGWLTMVVTDRSVPLPSTLLGLDHEQVLGLYHRLGDWLVQEMGLTRAETGPDS